MTITLPMASDTLRNEARAVREAAERAAEQMIECAMAARDAHAKSKRLRDAADDVCLTAMAIDGDAMHVRVSRSVLGRLRAALGDEQGADKP